MSRKANSIKAFPALWAEHEQLYHSVFREALCRLQVTPAQRKDENEISKALCPVLTTVCFEREGEVQTPLWEKPAQPTIPDELDSYAIGKRPDFTCKLVNPFATAPELYEISLHVECKRLGAKTASGWDLNDNYVRKGIARFDCLSHEYGKRAPSGMMLGYIVNREPAEILAEVNTTLKTRHPSFPALAFTFTSRCVGCEQALQRQNVKPNPFKLLHLWVDYRERLP